MCLVLLYGCLHRLFWYLKSLRHLQNCQCITGKGTTEFSTFESPTITLQDAANSYFNVSSTGGPESNHIPADDIAFVLNACRSQRKLAGRLAAKSLLRAKEQQVIAEGSCERRP